ncbi:unnamed protein product, partial [marine sediment metagenome]
MARETSQICIDEIEANSVLARDLITASNAR